MSFRLRRASTRISVALLTSAVLALAAVTALSAGAAPARDGATASAKKKKRAGAKSRCGPTRKTSRRTKRRPVRRAAARSSAKRSRAKKRSRRCARSRVAAVGVTITSAPSASTSQTSATFGWSTSGRVSKVSCSLDGAAPVACSSPKSYSGLAAGTHKFVVRVSKGNSTASDSRSWTVTSSTSTSPPPPPPPPPPAACADGADNDGDGKVDYPADPGCTGNSDSDETDSPPSVDDLALNKVATASSVEGPGYEASKANDGSSQTRWSSTFSNDAWWRVDLGSVQTVNRVSINWEAAYAASYRLEASTDGASYTEVWSGSASGAGPKVHDFNPISARYLRFVGVARSIYSNYSFWAFQVFNAAGTTAPPPPPPPAGYVFSDEFNGAAGTFPDSSKWMRRGNACDGNLDYACAKNENVFQDGEGSLRVRIKREPSNYLGGGPYSGGWIETYAYGSGWPPSPVLASWSAPYRIEARMKFPDTPGGWGGGWLQSVDRSTSQEIYELDWSEERTTYNTRAECHQHTWLNGRDIAPWDCAGTSVSDMGKNFHVFRTDVYPDRVEYFVDGRSMGTAPGAPGRHGLILNMGIGAPGSWGSGGQQPAASDPGPWDLLVDYVRVSSL